MVKSSVFFRILVWIVMIFVAGAIAVYLDFRYFPVVIKSVFWHLFSFLVGVVLMRVVIVISRNTGRTLAKYGRVGDLPRMETNRLVKEGVYAYMRHPMHLGLMLMPVAWGFVLGSPVFLLFFAPLEIVFILLMIKLFEEPEALRKFGKEYEIYMQRTPGFCFKKECLKALFEKVEK